MKKYQQLIKKNAGLLGTIFGSVLIALPTIPLAASAQSLSSLDQVNPCPGIYYEEPFNTTRMVPQGCPPNAATRGVPTRGMVPDRAVLRNQETFTEPLTPAPPPAGVPQPPLPEARSNPIAMVQPANGTVDVTLKNNTNAIVSYEAVGHTQRRFLPGGEGVVLQNLPTPVTITMVRQDEGLIKVIPASPEQGMLELSLQEETSLDDNQGALRIQEDGKVFLN
ncbi:MAG: hypothetical protein AB1589_11025 [Cyanobacteriota bacterium]